MRNVSLWLVVVVVGNEVLNRILGEHLTQLAGQLGSKSFIVGDDQGGTLELLNQPSGGGTLSSSGCTKENYVAFPIVDAISKLLDGCGLVSSRRVFANDFEGPLLVTHLVTSAWI